MLKKVIIITCLLLMFIISPFKIVNATNINIVDNAEIFDNEKILMEYGLSFFNKHNINIFYYTVETSTQEDFQKIMDDYKENTLSDFILFYIIKDNGNIGIYTSDSLKETVSDVNKILMLKSMETDLNNGKFEEAMICALENLELILEQQNSSSIIDNEKLDVDYKEKETKRILSLVLMIICAGIFIFNSCILIKPFLNKIKNNKKDC